MMKREFKADVVRVSGGALFDTWRMPPVITISYGCGEKADVTLAPGAGIKEASEWFGKRVRVTIETID